MNQPTAYSTSTHLEVSVLADIRGLSTPGEDLLAEVLRIFVAEVPPHIQALVEAIHAGNAQTAAQLAHRLRGTALGIGAPRLAGLCATVEYAARADVLDVALASADRLAAEYESTRIALEQEVCS